MRCLLNGCFCLLARQIIKQIPNRKGRTNRQEQPFRRQRILRIENSQNHKARRVISDRQKKQKADRRVFGPENNPANKIGKGDICGNRDSPAV